MGVLVARVQRRELDRDARAAPHVRAADLRQPRDRVRVGLVVADGVGVGAGGLAEHVVGVGVAALLEGARLVDGLVDVAPEHELLAEQLHRLGDGAAHDRLAEAADQRTHRPHGIVAVVEQAPGQHQAPGRRVDQRRARAPEVGRPVRVLELVGDELVDGLGVGYAQERLGEAHETDPLARRQPVLPEEALHHRRRVLPSERLDDVDRLRSHLLARAAVERHGGEELAHDVRLVASVLAADAGAERPEIPLRGGRRGVGRADGTGGCVGGGGHRRRLSRWRDRSRAVGVPGRGEAIDPERRT